MTLKQKLETLSSTYHQDLYKYHQELQTHKELVSELTNTLQNTQKEKQINQQKEIIESQLHSQDTDHTVLKQKLETLSSSYQQNLHKYRKDLQNKKHEIKRKKKKIEKIWRKLEQFEDIKDMISNLQQMIDCNTKQMNVLMERDENRKVTNNGMNELDRLSRDNDHLSVKNSILNQFIENNKLELLFKEARDSYNSMQNEENKMERRKNSNYNDDISNLKNEKQLYMQLDKEKKMNIDKQHTIENLMNKLESANDLNKKFETLKKAYKELKQFAKDELTQHIQMQKSIEAEAIYLAAKKANLEEERESLINLLDQRDYEITMLNNQLILIKNQKRVTSATTNIGTLGDEIGIDENDEYYDYNDGLDNIDSEEDDEMLDDKDEIDIIAEILDDEDLFGDDDNDHSIPQPKPQLNSKYTNEGQSQITNNLNNSNIKKRKKETEESRDKKAFDKIKEYLHLSASAVKIKYPTVKDIQSDELIKRVRELPFYKYHDQMVRIMETQIRDEKKKK
eukprot:366206_1